ncbi:uncharacterized protein LOC120262128 [Dioscorea cayenensis subsp. rotundata]|uniref:Uncharacterized protein LOC120262128 n=1 Tax=Dioscorea cayennensis subsp. rotundata TaxID=55577 RepID=A0AB40BFQ3_DIOCR|nr:uncharacterized protein LOC120262128 [Dioscorea cayenensis subsp. rotundata]
MFCISSATSWSFSSLAPMEDIKAKHVPVFGYWNSCDELPELYFEFFGEDGESFNVARNQKSEQKPKRVLKVSKAVDEDLYKIPPELFYQKSHKKRFLRSFWFGCLGLNCIS